MADPRRPGLRSHGTGSTANLARQARTYGFRKYPANGFALVALIAAVVGVLATFRPASARITTRICAATVAGEASDGGAAIDVVRRAMPDVVLMDLSMPTVQGVEAIKAIAEELPHVKILVLSASEAEANVLEAIKLGAAGYLLKTSTAA